VTSSFANKSEDCLTVIIAAHNEENYIAACLQALTRQTISSGHLAVVVAANACSDRTVEIVETFRSGFKAKGWPLYVLDIPEAGKLNAFNNADQIIAGGTRLYLDADVLCDPELLEQIRAALDTPGPRYATGTLQVTRARTWVTRRYADMWVRLPFVQSGTVGAGCFAVNSTGRARWGAFPDIISDDTFVRLHFSPEERHEVPAAYHWPMVEGFRNLVRVRRRQDAGVAEVRRCYPALEKNDGKFSLSTRDLIRLFFDVPAGFLVYMLVHVTVRLRAGGSEWTRGR